jgi:hypothetical protein
MLAHAEGVFVGETIAMLRATESAAHDFASAPQFPGPPDSVPCDAQTKLHHEVEIWQVQREVLPHLKGTDACMQPRKHLSDPILCLFLTSGQATSLEPRKDQGLEYPFLQTRSPGLR